MRILELVSESGNSAKKTEAFYLYISINLHVNYVNYNQDGLFEDFQGQNV